MVVLFQFEYEPELVPLQLLSEIFCNLQPRFAVLPDVIDVDIPDPFTKNERNGEPVGEIVTLTVSAGTVAPVVSTQPDSVYVRVTANALAFAGMVSELEPPAEDREPVQSLAELDAVQLDDARFVVVHTIFTVPPEDGSTTFV